MTTQATDTHTAESSATAMIVVEAGVERAFAVFTDGIDSWWPREHTIGKAPLAEMVLEPRVGGRAYGRDVNGGESDWGRVLVYEPPDRVVVSWDINLRWGHEADSAKASEFEVRFLAEGPSRTRVELEHRHLDRHGDGWEAMRDAVGSPDGWNRGLRAFAEAAAA
jgi:uncharacterized protein YndB with AHSA1/START domain